MTSLPISSAADASVDWIQGALASGGIAIAEGVVKSVRSEPLDAGRGNLGSIARLRLEYESADIGHPQTLILKYAPPDASPLLRSWRFGRREALFYRKFGGRGPLRMPRCYHASYDDRSGGFSLLLEDLSAAETADQEIGASRAQAELAVEQLARFHAHFMGDETLDAEGSWLGLPNANREAFEFFVKRAWRTCATRYPELPTSTPKALEDLERVYPSCLDRVSAGPVTLLHGDYRLDNMLFESAGWSSSFAALDWQLAGRGRGPWDLAHFIVGSMTPESRSLHGSELTRRYHGIVEASRIGQYPLEECVLDFNAGVLGTFTLAAVLVDSQCRSLGAPARTMDTWLRRASLAVNEALATL